MSRVPFLNGRFDAITLPQAVDALFDALAAGKRGWVCTVNVAYLMMMRADPRLQGFVDRAALAVADGQPLIWCSRWLGTPLPGRVPGIDLVLPVAARAAREGKRIYLLGATAEIIGRVAQLLRERHPGLYVECADGYFSADEAPARADAIRASRADFVFVGMGVPRQERFIEEQWTRMEAGVAVGVGGSFDVLAGLRVRAPVWVQRIGMEWLFRLAQEPRRLFARYMVTNTRFVSLVLAELLKK